MPPVLCERDGHVGRVTLNRPDAMNAITTDLARGLADALRTLGASASAVVIRGAGGNFCVGGDFDELEALRREGAEATARLFAAFADACSLVADLPVPVVAAVEGYAMAGGFELMQACDIAIVREDAVLADNHANYGQVPGGGGSQLLPRLVGRQRASAHILTGDRLSGAEAAAWGLAYRAPGPDAFDGEVEDLLGRLAGKTAEAQARTKRLIRRGLEMPLSEALELERRTVVEHLGGEAAAAGIASFVARDDGAN